MRQQPTKDQLLDEIRARTILREEARYRNLMEIATISQLEYYLGNVWERMTWIATVKRLLFLGFAVWWMIWLAGQAGIAPWIGFLGACFFLEINRLHGRTAALATLYSEFPNGRPRPDKNTLNPLPTVVTGPTPPDPIPSLPG